MIKKVNRIILLVIFIEIILWISSRAYAAGISIKTSKSTVKPGESFTVTVSVTNGAGKVSASVSNGSGGFGSTWLENSSKSFTCKAGNSGNVTIKTSGTVADFTTEKDEDASRSKSVTIKKESTSKSENKKVTTTKKQQSSKEDEEVKEEKTDERLALKSLKVDEANLTPEFKSDLFEYEIYVKDLEKINISAESNNSQSFIDITGNENLQYGENYILINLRGQDDKDNTEYKIKVIKEKSDLTVAKEEIDVLKKKNNNIKILCICLAVILIFSIAVNFILINRLRKRKNEK